MGNYKLVSGLSYLVRVSCGCSMFCRYGFSQLGCFALSLGLGASWVVCFHTRVGYLPLVVARRGKLSIFLEQVMSVQALLHLGKLQRHWEPNLEARITPAETHGRKIWAYKTFVFLLWLTWLLSASLL